MAKVSEDFIKKSLNCKTLDEIQALAKAEGIELTLEEAKRFLADANSTVSEEMLDKVAGGADGYVGSHVPVMMYVTNC